MKRILVTGSLGQIGTELVIKLREKYGLSNVIASDIRFLENNEIVQKGLFVTLDVLNYQQFLMLAQTYKVDTIIHLAALLSARAEENPELAWNLNIQGLWNGLKVAKALKAKFFYPSSIAAFGKGTPSQNTPQLTIQRPSSIYGISKVSGELLCEYFFQRYQIDTRGLRFPGLVSYKTLPGGGTTDYAVAIYYQALLNNAYQSYLAKDTKLDLMYIDDAIEAIIKLMEADPQNLVNRNAYNISAMSLSPHEVAQSIKKFLPHFKISYKVDPLRQKLADSWPNAIDSSIAQKEWGFQPRFDLDQMSALMLEKLHQKLFKKRDQGTNLSQKSS